MARPHPGKSKNNKRLLPKLCKTPRKYQKKGIRFIDNHKGRALIADKMGLGKTIQAIGYSQMNGNYPVLILCPASVKFNWVRELNETLPKKPDICVLSGKKPFPIPKGGKNLFIVCNYDIVASWKKEIMAAKCQLMICDEIHKIKTSTTKRTKGVLVIGKTIPNVIGLSGTPIENRPEEIYTTIKLIRPDLVKSEWKFWWDYCDMRRGRYGWEHKGSSNPKGLKKILSKFMLRRHKEDVLDDLPAKIKTVVPMEVNMDIYNSIYAEFLAWRKAAKKKNKGKDNPAEAMVKLGKLKRAAAMGKIDSVVEWARDFIESDEKLILFTAHQDVIDYLMTKLKYMAVKIDGGCSQTQRKKAIKDFQTDNRVRLFIGNMKAAGEGVDGLQNVCSNVGIVEFPWNPSLLEQAEDRLHRIGQQGDSVNVWYLVAKGTVEEDIAEALTDKQNVINEIVDGGRVFGEKDLLEIILNKL